MPHRQLHLDLPAGLWPLNWPMGLTMLRLLLLPVFVYLLLLDAGPTDTDRPHRWWALGVFAVMALTDKLDGYLARRLGQASHLGAMLDPVADKLLLMISLILLASERVAPPGFAIPLWVVGVVYAKDLLIVVGTLYVLARVRGIHVHARWLGKIGTAVQLVLVLWTLLAPDVARMPGERAAHGLHDALWVAVVAVSVASCVDYGIVARKVLKTGEPQRHRGTES
jgi:CDP-diacylglycerol--glycerol-3-phosphate 3-phosphatidyltransferase